MTFSDFKCGAFDRVTFTAVLQSVKSESERQTQLRSEAEGKLREAETQLKSIQAKSKQLINGMQSQLEEQSKARVSRPTATSSSSMIRLVCWCVDTDKDLDR